MIDLMDRYPQEVINHSCWEVVHHKNDRVADCPFLKTMESRRRESAVQQLLGRWFNIITDPIINQSGKLVGVVHIMIDITERKRFEEQLRESEIKFRSLAEQSLVGTYIIQGEAFKYVNPRFAEIFGYSVEHILGRKRLQDLVLPDDRQGVTETIEKRIFGEKQYVDYEFRGQKEAGDVIYLEIYGSRAFYQGKPAIIGIILDITEKKKLESQLLHAQKMEAVGQLTGGIAHDFNNILSAIVGYATLLQMRMKADDADRLFVDQILASSDRAANLTRSLLTFSRKQVTSLTEIDINENIRRVEKLLQRIIGEDIELRTSLVPGSIIVNADSGQIEQVLMNLATNARDAMQHGGIFSIETILVGSVSPALQGENKESGNYVLISVTDTGSGMDDKTREKIFEPFFTTKDPGRGTGLGLSMVYGIIRQHNGSILCYSEPGMGTTFKIYLPVPTALQTEDAGKPVPASPEEPGRGNETILVAEDDETLRVLAKTTLEDFGYTVIDAVDGKDAVERFRQHKDKIRLVLSDIIMPKMSGGEVREAILAMSRKVPIVFMSGYPADIIRKKSLFDADADIMLKPFSPTALLRKVREVLDRE